jgi:molybdopterin-containing oxidoreductase family membrane subunit
VAELTYRKVNDDLLSMLRNPTRAWYTLFAIDLFILSIGAICWIHQIQTGIGVAGKMRPVMWAQYITDFVFWIGIGHAGTLISAVLFLFRAKFRNSIYRTAEGMTVFAVMTAGLFPLIHLGRVWFFYWLIPYPNQRQLWTNFRSPLEWDVFAVSTYLTISSVFFIVGLIPDLAVARERATGLRKMLYTLLSFNWRGTDKQWKHYNAAYLYFAALATPLVFSVHSVVSWDFAMSINPGWHSTIFAPYFVAGAIFSGIAMVITLMVPLRKIFGLEKYLGEWHFDSMGKILLFTSLIVFYAYATEYFIAWYSGNTYEMSAFWDRAFGPMAWAFWIMAVCNCFIPLLCIKKSIRTNVWAMFAISICVNIGMWYERYVIITQSLSHNFDPWVWRLYKPTIWDTGITLGSFAWFGMFFLLFIKFLPAMAIVEIKEILPTPLKKVKAA